MFFSQTPRQPLKQLACPAPAEVGWQVPHGSSRSWAEAAVEPEIGADIDDRTLGRLLRAAPLPPHVGRHWKTPIGDDPAVARAVKILGVYQRMAWLGQPGVVVLALDEKPNIQVLERAYPTQLMGPGPRERPEFDDVRHGPVNRLVSLTLHTGHRGLAGLPPHDGAPFRPAVRRWLHPYGWASPLGRILDNDPSHTSADTWAFLEARAPRVRGLFTP